MAAVLGVQMSVESKRLGMTVGRQKIRRWLKFIAWMLGTTIGRQKIRRWLKILAWITVGLFIVYLGLGLLVVTAFRSSHYNLSHSMTIAAAVTNAIAPAFAYQYDPYVGPIFDWPPRYDGLCEAIINRQSIIWKKRRLSEISGRCYLAHSRGGNELCTYWWLGRECLVFSVPSEILSDSVTRQRLLEAVRNPCSFLPDVKDISPPGKQYLHPPLLRRSLGCNEQPSGQRFDTYLILEEDAGERVEYFPSDRTFLAKYLNF